MPDSKKLHPPQWLGRPILHDEHVQDLETRAAINEFHHKMPRHEAEQGAHDSYVKEQRERAAAHHLAGMKASIATGNHEDARKHWALYDLHLKSLGKESVGAVPPEIEKRMMEEHGDKPVYKFKAHKGDLYALHQPSKDVAPAEGQPMQKGEAGQCKWKLGERRCQRKVSGSYCHDHVDHWANKIKQKEPAPIEKGFEGYKAPADGHGEYHHCVPGKGQGKGGESCGSFKVDRKDGKAKDGSPKCPSCGAGSAPHDWENPAHDRYKVQKADWKPPAIAPVAAPKQPTTLPTVAPKIAPVSPPAGVQHLGSPAPAAAAPALHSNVEGFMGALKALPKGDAARGKLITQHMNHGPFLSALQQHPQGKQIHQMLTQHLNSAANAGVKPGKTVTVVKSEVLDTARQLLKAVAELAKGKLLQFPGNPAPAQDQGKPAEVAGSIAPKNPDRHTFGSVSEHVGHVLAGECGARALDDEEDYDATKHALARHFKVHPDVIHQELQHHQSRCMDDNEDLGHVTIEMSRHLRDHLGIKKPRAPKK